MLNDELQGKMSYLLMYPGVTVNTLYITKDILATDKQT